MNFLSGNPEIRGGFIKSLGAIARPQIGAGKVVESIDDYFQQAPITSDNLAEVLGSPDEFMERYKSWENKYRAALDTQADASKSNRVLASLRTKMGFKDLNMLTKEASDSLHSDFLRSVLRVDTLMYKYGAPGMQLPSGNNYRHPFMFSMDNTKGVAHPAENILNGMIFNINTEQTGLDAVNIGRKIKGYDILNQEWQRASSMESGTFAPFGKATGINRRIATLDIESTGLFRGAQVRSISVNEMILGETGEFISDPKTIFNVGFASPQFNGMTVTEMNYGTMSINNFLMKSEFGDGNKMFQMGDEFLDKTSDILEHILDADMLAGHNIGYDLDMITETMLAQDGFNKHKRAGKLVGRLYDKIGEGDFVVDTANSARGYMMREGEIAVKAFEKEYNEAGEAAGRILTSQERHQAKLQLLTAPELLAKGAILDRSGKAAFTYASVSNIVMNTNLAELIEQDSPEAAQELFGMINKGSHIAETDTHLQAYIGKYMQDSKLKLKSNWLKQSGAQATEFGEFVRAKVSKSSAVTGTTNIASVRQMSDKVFEYVSDRGLTGVQMKASIGDLVQSGMVKLDEITQDIGSMSIAAKNMSAEDVKAMQGTIAFSQGKFVYSTGVGTVQELDTQMTRGFLQARLKEARDTTKDVTVSTMKVGGVSHSLTRSIADDLIYDTGVSFGTASTVDQLSKLTNIRVSSTSPTAEGIIANLGSIYEDFGAGMPMRSMVSGENRGTVFQRGFKDYGEKELVSMGEKYASLGDPYARLLDPQARAFSSVVSKATADIAQQAAEVSAINKVDANLTASFANQGLVAELRGGVFESQKTMRLLDLSEGVVGPTSSKVMIQPQIVKGILSGITEEQALAAGATGINKLQMSVGLSTVDYGGKSTMNVVWQVGEQVNRQGSELFVQNLFGLMTNEVNGATGQEKVAKMLGSNVGDLSENIMEQISAINMITDQDKSGVMKQMSEFIYSNGIVIAKANEKVTNEIVEGASQFSIDLNNDQINSIRARVSTTNLPESEFIALDPFHNAEAIKVAGASSQLDEAAGLVDSGNGTMISRSVHAANEIVRTADASEGGLKSVESKISRKTIGIGDNKLRGLYMANKSNIKAGAIGVAAAGLGYIVAKRHRENSIYEETMKQQPREKGRGVDTMNSSAKTFTQNSPRMSDPLSTAGVVGNLDRNKIGHTRMGNGRNDHLFGS